MSEAYLEVRELRKTFGTGQNEVHALQSIDFQIEQGEFVAIMGPSGSGKSTLMHILGGMERPSEGKIFMEGQEVNRLLFNEPSSTKFRREKIGFIFQSFNLLSGLTAEENVSLPLMLAGEDKKKLQLQTEEMLRFVGLAEARKRQSSKMSGGQQQRVAIARALIHQPDLVIADEPTGNLDSVTTNQVLELFAEMKEALGQTILLVTHEPDVAARAERVIYLKDGKVEHDWYHEKGQSDKERVAHIMDHILPAN